MRQVVLRAGRIQLVSLPTPMPGAGRVLVGNAASVISSGTERAAVKSSAGGSLPVRAVRNPELARKAIEHVRERGLRRTLDLARGATAPDTALGYSCAGVVLDTGGVPNLRVGQRVACAGAGYACHAEIVSVPANLVCRVPDSVACAPRHLRRSAQSPSKACVEPPPRLASEWWSSVWACSV